MALNVSVASSWFETWVTDQGGVWQAVSAIFTVAAVLIAIWATFRVLEEERKSRLKDELRAVRESLASLISAHGEIHGAVYPFWKVGADAWPEREFPYNGALSPFADQGVQQQGRVTEAAYRIMGAGEILIASIRGARSMGNHVWNGVDIDRLTRWIRSYSNRSWKLPYFLLVATKNDDAFDPWTGYRLVDESLMEGGSAEYVDLVAQRFADGRHPGLVTVGDAETSAISSFYDETHDILLRAVSAFLELGDAAAEDRRALRRRRPKAFMRDQESGEDLLAVAVTPYRVEQPTGPLYFQTADGKTYQADAYAQILSNIWTDYAASTDNEPLALGRRQMAAARLAQRTNRSTLRMLEASGIELTAEQREILESSAYSVPDQFRRDKPYAWQLGVGQLVLVDDLFNRDCYEPDSDVPLRPIGNVRFLDAQTERGLLESIGTFHPPH